VVELLGGSAGKEGQGRVANPVEEMCLWPESGEETPGRRAETWTLVSGAEEAENCSKT